MFQRWLDAQSMTTHSIRIIAESERGIGVERKGKAGSQYSNEVSIAHMKAMVVLSSIKGCHSLVVCPLDSELLTH